MIVHPSTFIMLILLYFYIMLEKVLQSILRRYFGEFITGLENVALAFWTGKINIQNASFKHAKINELLKMHNMPLSIAYSYLGSLQLDIPWNKLSSAPVNIKLTDVYLVFTLQQFAQSMMPQALNENSKYLLIKNYVQHILAKEEEMKGQGQKESGFLKKLLIKILHNVNLQISNIHIRIETNKHKGTIEQDEIFYSCIGQDNKPTDFSLGFCIESMEADTINAQNKKQYVHIENDKTPIRKNINMKQISFYWEEESVVSVTGQKEQKKAESMRTIIGRQQYRLLTLDGSLLMQKNKQKLDYFFSTSFRVLQIKTNYQQLKQIIQVTQAFINARKKKKLVKQKEIKHEKQLQLRDSFNRLFKELFIDKFQTVTEECIKLIESVNRKLLMQWTRAQTIEMLKRSKLKIAEQNKNRRTWLGFLSKNSQLTLSQQEIRQIELQIESFIEMIQNNNSLSVGLYLFIRSIHIVMDHHKKKQKMFFIADEIQLNLENQDKTLKVELRVDDIGLTYKDIKKWTEVPIFKKNCQNDNKIMKLQVVNTPQEQKLEFESEAMMITHEIQFLSFISQMINIQEREEVKANVILLNSQPLNRPRRTSTIQPEPVSSEKDKKIYNYNVRMKRMEMKVELDSNTHIHAYMQGITIEQNKKVVNHHWASLTNMGVNYINTKYPAKNYSIVEDINIGIDLTGLKMLKSEIPKIKVVLNEESLYQMGTCLKQQYKLLKIQKKQYKNELAQQQQKYMEGEVQIISLFKSLKIYHAILVEDRMILFEKSQDGRVDYSRTSKTIFLNNLSVSRSDEMSFKLQSVTIDQILHCKSTIQTDRWIYHIEQRILETSSKQKIFEMLDNQQESQQQERTQAHIYIPYDSTIDLRLNFLEVVYQKNNVEKILSLKLANLNIILKENNIQFQRRIHLEELLIKNLTVKDEREEYNTLVSNMLNYFQDPDDDSEQEDQQPNISFVIEGKKKTHPKYTGEIAIKAKLNKLFVNYNAQFVFEILYRLVYGNQKAKAYPEPLRNAKIIQFLKEILEERLDIPKKYENAQKFQYSPAYFEIDQYKKLYPSLVLFHFEVHIQEAEVHLVNGLNNIWMHKILIDRPELYIDKNTDFIFLKGQAKSLELSDITGYPHTSVTPFTQQPPYTLVSVRPEPNQPTVVCKVGLFPPMAFINKQHFKNYFSMQFQNLQINYQQQPVLRFIDFLTNQIILFIMEPFSLHKYDTPNRGSYVFGHVNFTESEVKKILYESVYPTYTHLRIEAHNLEAMLNTHPHMEGIPIKIKNAMFFSSPYINNQRVHVRLDQIRKFERQYKTLQQINTNSEQFENRVSKFQWVTRYLITATGLSSPIFENQFNHQMYFQRANNGDKDLLLPFIVIDKQLQMQGKIKHLSATANKQTYDLINKCFMYNISFDDKKDSYFVTNHKFQSISNPSKLYYSLRLGQLAFLIPDVHRTVVVIPDCQYKFIREVNMVKIMEINGKGLHVFGNNQKYNLFRPINFNEKNGLEYKITMETNGDKFMLATLNNVDFEYEQDYFMELLKYFLLSEDCFPKQEVYEDIPLIKLEVQFKNSFYRIAQNSQFVYALKGDIDVVWTRPKNLHPEVYKANKDLYPLNSEAQCYDALLKGVSLRKYTKKFYANKEKNYRALSLPMQVKVRIANIMKRQGDIFYNDMVGDYDLEFVCLKLCYKDVLDLQASFGGGAKPEEKKMEQKVPESPQMKKNVSAEKKRSIDRKPTQFQIQGYTSHARHTFNINRLSLQMGLSQLPVPLLNFTLNDSKSKLELIGFTKIITNQLNPTLEYWNMLIGRWQPIIEKACIDELTLRLGNETYCSLGSSKPLLINFSTEAIKVLKLVGKDIGQKGELKMLSRKGMIQGMHVSPYALTNRTGHNILIENSQVGDFTQVESNKLKPNETTHVYNKTPDLVTTIDTIKYQIEGDPTEYEVNFNQVDSLKKLVIYNQRQHSLWLEVISSPILKQIVISSPYVIYNRTSFTMVLKVGEDYFEVEADKKMAIPFTMDIKADSIFGLTFPHLKEPKPTYSFTLLDIEQGYEHSTTYGESKSFVCLVHLRKNNEQLITVSPLTTFVNLLPLNLKLEAVYTKPNQQKQVIEEDLEVSKEKHLYEFGSKSKVTMRIKFTGFNYSAFHDVAYNHENSEGKMAFIDHRGLQTYVLTKTITRNKQKLTYLYLETVMINQTDYPLYVYSQAQLLAGQRIRGIVESESKYTIVNQAKNISIGFKQDDYGSNAKINKQQLGNQFLQVPKDDRLVQLVLNSSVHCVDEKLQLFTKIMKITPRFIVRNKCKRDICLRQVNTEQRYYLRVGELSDWVWHSKDDTRQLTITAADNDIGLRDGWDFSAPIEPETLEETVIVLRPNNRSDHRLLIKLQVFKESQYTYIIFKELSNPEDSLLTFKNNMSFAHLQIHQSFLENISPPWNAYKDFSCKPNSQTLFGWDYPGQDHEVVVQFNFLDDYKDKFQCDQLIIDLDRLNKPKIFEFKSAQDQILEVEVSVEYIGIHKKIIFQSMDQSSTSRLYEEQLEFELTKTKIGLSLSQIGISLIAGHPRCEILFTSIKKLELIIMEKQFKRTYELKIKYINIDNNFHHNTIFPVLFTPLKERKTIEKPRPFLIVLAEQNLKSTQIMEINYFRMAIQPISFKLYDEIVTKIYDMRQELNEPEEETTTDLKDTYRSYAKQLEWREKELAARDKSIFIRQIQIGRLIVELSFSIKPTSGGNIVIYTIVTLFRTALSNVSESQIKLSRFYRKNINMPDLINQMGEFYRKELFKEIYKIPTSINILGNPYVLVNYLAEGVWEIINQPSEGFIKGPIQGAIGVVKGGVYFTRNVVAGISNSFEVISQSCSHGISYVTFDEKFITRRDKIQMQKSKHLWQGTKSAAFALYTGFEVAITGLYRHPKEQLQQNGAPGFFKGMAIGVAGLVTKPLSGMFEGISKFSQGVKNTALFFQDGPNSTRSRPPRVFIGQQQYFTQYNLQQSKAINLLEFHSTKYLNSVIFLVSIDVDPVKNETIYLVLTDKYLVKMSKASRKIINEINIQDISQVFIPKANELKLMIGEQPLLLYTHKFKQMYECFRVVFELLERNMNIDEEMFNVL